MTVEERLGSQLLAGPPAVRPTEVVDRLLAVQAQDPRGFRLAIRARSSGLSTDAVDAALDAGELLVDWLNRGTLHLVRRDDHAWLHALTTPALRTGNARRLAQEGVSPAAAEHGVEAIRRALVEHGTRTRAQLRGVLDEAGVPTAGQALVHVLFLAALDGVLVRGPFAAGGEQVLAHREDWLGPAPAVDRDAALAELARRYLTGHSPASDRDLARWAGLPLRDARAGLRAISAELVERPDGLVHLAALPPSPRASPPRLLGAFDPVLLGWVSRAEIVGGNARLVCDNGIFRPFALVRGRAVGLWRIAGGRVELAPFEPIGADDGVALDREARDVVRFLGLDVARVG